MTDAYDVAIELRRLEPHEKGPHSEVWRWIVNNWMGSVGKGQCQPMLGGQVLMTEHWHLVVSLIERGDVVIAHQPGAPDLFVGWACGEPERGVHHYCYVKHAFRRGGVAIRMVQELYGDQAGIRYSHQSTRHKLRDAARQRGWRYNPYTLIEVIHGERESGAVCAPGADRRDGWHGEGAAG